MQRNDKIIKDVLLLYEISLSVGQSPDLKTNCDIFLKTLLARKNLAFGSVWIKDSYLFQKDNSDQATLVYANPEFRIRERHLPLKHSMFSLVQEKEVVSLASSDDQFSEIITEKGITKGSFAIFGLGDLGVLKLFTPNREIPFEEIELNQLKGVIAKFTISLEGCLAHERVKREIRERQQIEDKLRTTTSRLITLMDNLQEGIVVEDASRQIIYVNEMFCKMFGITDKPRNLIGADCSKATEKIKGLFVNPDTFIRRIEEIISERRIVTGEELMLVDGRILERDYIPIFIGQSYHGHMYKYRDITVRKRVEEELNAHRNHLESLVEKRTAELKLANIKLRKEITERKRAMEALAESENRLRAIVESEPECVMLVDSDGRLLEMNATGLNMIEADSLEQVSGKSLYPIILPEYRPAFKALTESVFRGKSGVLEFEIIGLKGTNRCLESHAVPLRDAKNEIIALLAVTRDITERIRTEKALRESEERYRRLIEEDLTGDYITTPDGKLLFCNPAFARIFGFESVEEAMNYNIALLYPSLEDRDKFLELLRKKKKLELHEMELRTCHRKPVYVIQNAIGTFNNKGELVEIRGYLFDITERKHLEEQFRQAQKMEAIGVLAGGVAHDFNNLLTVITGYCQLLLNRLAKNDPLRKEVEQINEAGERAASLTNQLLAFSRRQVMQPKVLNLNSVILNMDRMLRRLIGEDIVIKTSLDPNLGNVKVDPTQIEQIIMNLAVNARDAMPQGGKFTIETANIYIDETHTKQHVSVQTGPYVLLAISDNGSGMDAETQARIFEPFFTTKGPGKGTGLGLSTVYGIVKQFGGNIWVYSEPGEGTTFKIYLPRVSEEVKSVKHRQVSVESLRGSETILLVEDEKMVRDLASEILQEYNYNVLVASNPAEAISICEQSRNTIHLLLTDVVMPGMSGPQLSEKLKSLHPEIKVLYMSGYADNAIIQHGVLKPGTPFIQKPFLPQNLLKKVRQILEDRKGEKMQRPASV